MKSKSADKSKKTLTIISLSHSTFSIPYIFYSHFAILPSRGKGKCSDLWAVAKCDIEAFPQVHHRGSLFWLNERVDHICLCYKSAISFSVS